MSGQVGSCSSPEIVMSGAHQPSIAASSQSHAVLGEAKQNGESTPHVSILFPKCIISTAHFPHSDFITQLLLKSMKIHI